MKKINFSLTPLRESNVKKKLDKVEPTFAEKYLHIREEIEPSIFLLKNGDLGAIFRIEGIYDECLTTNEVEERIGTILKSIRSISLGVPSHEQRSNTVIQVLMRQRKVSKEDVFNGSHENYKKDDLRKLFEEEDFYQFKTQNITKREFLISFRFVVEEIKGHPIKENIKKFLQRNLEGDDFQRDVEGKRRAFKEEISNFKHNICKDFKIEELKSSELIDFLQKYFPSEEEVPVVTDIMGLHQQVIFPNFDLDHQKGKFSCEGGSFKLFYLDQLPEKFKYGQFKIFLNEIPLLEYDISWNISHGGADVDNELVAKESWFSGKPTRQKEAKNFSDFRENLNTRMPKVIQSFRLIARNLNSDKEGLLQSVAMNFLGARLVKESQIPAHMFISSLPLNCLPVENKVKGGRFRTIKLEKALAFCPIFDGPSQSNGTRNWISRQGTLTKFDLFAGQGNRMTAILADTRAGKSVFNANQILEFMARYPQGVVRVIDKKSSYQKLGDLTGGRVVSFSESVLKEDPYSPFALKGWDEDDMENLFLLISTVLVQKNEGINFSACHSEVLKESIKSAYNAHFKNLTDAKKNGLDVDPHPVWNDILTQMPQVCKNLRDSGVSGAEEAKEDLARWSVNLYETGQYGFLFSKHEVKKDEHRNDRFLTYDLDGITDPILEQLAAMMAFIKIGRDLAKLPRSTPKLVIFEELGMLLHGDGKAQVLMNEFILMVIKTCAKLNAQAIAITNEIKDYTKKDAGKTIWNKSSQKIFLPLGEQVDEAKKSWSERYNEADFQIIESLEKEFHLKRSQAYIKSNNEVAPYKGTIIIPLSPFFDAICTTSGPQVEKYNELRKEGKTCMESLIEMADKYPYGQNLEENSA